MVGASLLVPLNFLRLLLPHCLVIYGNVKYRLKYSTLLFNTSLLPLSSSPFWSSTTTVEKPVLYYINTIFIYIIFLTFFSTFYFLLYPNLLSSVLFCLYHIPYLASTERFLEFYSFPRYTYAISSNLIPVFFLVLGSLRP